MGRLDTRVGAVQTGVQLWVVFYEGNKSFVCATKQPITLSQVYICIVITDKNVALGLIELFDE